jgi:glycosyltransferase involved in cell wall biosynthesis
LGAKLKRRTAMSQPTVSILTPSFNQGSFIQDCLSSVSNQTYLPLEHIVMDGGSTDSTLDILRNTPGRLSWTSEADQGQSHALNKAFSKSTGEIIGWLNSDDAYADRRVIEQAVSIFQEYPEVGLVYGHSLMIDDHNRILQIAWSPKNAQKLLPILTTFLQPSVLMRRSVLDEPFVEQDLNFIMDRDLWSRLVSKTKFRRLNLIAGVDRHHGARKVESSGYFKEKETHSKHRGYGFKSIHKAIRIGIRLRGAAEVPGIWRKLQPAIDLNLESRIALAVRQGAVPRRYMIH